MPRKEKKRKMGDIWQKNNVGKIYGDLWRVDFDFLQCAMEKLLS